MKIALIILFLLITTFTHGQNVPRGKYVNDRLNEYNYIIFNADSTFKYRYAVSLTHDIACGKYQMNNDTILLFYLTDMRDTCCNKDIDIDNDFQYDSLVIQMRPSKLYYKNEKLYDIVNGEVRQKVVLDSKPPKTKGIHRKYLIIGQFVNTDAYYMINESNAKWNKKNKKASR